MTAILKVDTIQDTAGNNIINESSNTITIGKSGDAVNLASGATNNLGITQADQWRITAGFNTTGGDVTANWERIDTDGPGLIGSGVSESCGIFTFPETGIYLVSAQSFVSATSGAISSQAINLKTTLDNSSYSSAALSYDSSSTTNYNASFFCSTLFDVTDTSTHKVKLAVITGGTSIFDGNTSHTATGMTFIRLGNT